MSRTFLSLSFVCAVVAAAAIALAPSVGLALDIDVMSLNVRADLGDDGANDWTFAGGPRRDKTVNLIQSLSPDLFGIQEALAPQIADLQAALPNYGYVGSIAGTKSLSGESAGIFYDKTRFTFLTAGTMWLSDTPNIPGSIMSEAIGPATVHTATWAKLYDFASASPVFVMNSHWYDTSDASLERSAQLVRQRLDQLVGNTPAIVMGSFYAAENSNAYATIQGSGSAGAGSLVDAYRAIHPVVDADERTMHNFTGAAAGTRSDYIFVSESFDVSAASIVRSTFGGGYPSDHFPVVATVGSSPELTYEDPFDVSPSTLGWTVSASGASFTANGQGQVRFQRTASSGRVTGTLTRSFNAVGLSNVAVSLAAFQDDQTPMSSSLRGFERDDFLRIEYNLGAGFVTLLEDGGAWQGIHDPALPSSDGSHALTTVSTSAGLLPLPAGAANNPNLQLRVTLSINTSDEHYYLDHFLVSGTIAGSPAPAAQIPEPSSAMLVVAGAASILICSRRRRRLAS